MQSLRTLGLPLVLVALVGCSGATPSASPAASVPPASAAAASPSPAASPPAATSPSAAASPSAAGGGGSTLAVTIRDFSFNPASIDAKVGETVTWTHNGEAPHTVTFDDGEDSGSLANGDDYSRTFDAAGSFPYKCSVHPAMTGTVEVSA